jgi:carboxyl-terminal processing protease
LGALRLTIQGFYRVNGESTQKRGVASDVILPSVTDSEDFSEAKLDHVLDLDKIASSKFAPANLIGPDLVQKVRAASVDRRAKSDGFAKLEKRIASFREFTSRKTLTFNETKLKQDRADRKALAELDPDSTNPDEKKTERRFGESVYEREVLSIAADLSRFAKRR